MPKLKPARLTAKYPPIDKLLACILERKLKLHLTYADLAQGTNTNADYIRHMVTEVPTDRWNPAMRDEICRQLGIRIKVEVEDLYNIGKTNE